MVSIPNFLEDSTPAPYTLQDDRPSVSGEHFPEQAPASVDGQRSGRGPEQLPNLLRLLRTNMNFKPLMSP